MNEAGRHDILADLRAVVCAQALGARPSGSLPSLPFGVAEIDAALPTGGLALGAVHEVLGGGADLGQGASAALWIGGILARISGPVIWIYSRRDLFAPALAGVGLRPNRVTYVEAGDAKTVLSVVEESLRHVGLAAVVGEIDRKVGLTACRRLQQAAETSGVLGLLLRRPRRLATDLIAEPTAARTRWRVTVAPGCSPLLGAPSTPGLARVRWELELFGCRGGAPRTFEVGACDAQGHLVSLGPVVEEAFSDDLDFRRTANG